MMKNIGSNIVSIIPEGKVESLNKFFELIGNPWFSGGYAYFCVNLMGIVWLAILYRVFTKHGVYKRISGIVSN
jgi:hypothetical protein